MPTKNFENEMLSCWTSERRRIYDWIKTDLKLPVYAEAYRGAVIFSNRRTPGHVTFVSHICRDIMNGMAADFKGIDRQQVQYNQIVESLKSNWEDAWSKEDAFTEGARSREKVSVSRKFCIKVKELIDEHNKGRKRNEDHKYEFFQTFLDYKDKESISKHTSEKWEEARNWFLSKAHLRRKIFCQTAEAELQEHFRDIEQTLLTAADSVRNRLKSIDDILEKANE